MMQPSSVNQNFGGQVAALRPFLLRLAVVQLQDKALAEDVVQEALLAGLKGEGQFQGRANLKTWLISILKYKIIDAIRDRRRLVPLAQFGPTDDDEYDPAPFEALFDAKGCWVETSTAWSDPQTVAERTAFFDVLEACLTRLPERTSRAFLMREWLETEPDDICGQLQITPGNLRILLYRARMQLRICLDKNWEQQP